MLSPSVTLTTLYACAASGVISSKVASNILIYTVAACSGYKGWGAA
jgi:hypothetical protein